MNDEEDEWVVAFMITLQSDQLQVLYASAMAGSPVITLADVAEKTISQWPNRGAVRETDNGLLEGDVWSALPIIGDLPEGMTYDSEREIHF